LQLETERLRIRDFVPDYVAAVYAYGSDPEVVRYMIFPPSTLQDTREHIARCMRAAAEQPRQIYDLGVVLISTNDLIGGITLGITDMVTGQAAFSYLFNRTYWGQGYATEALRRVVQFGFDHLGLVQLADSCDRRNNASARVMEKCGFRCVEEQDDELFYALTVQEWRQRRTIDVPPR
jgi:RimJ/RimL family protein N-acetyltransferase